MSVRAEGPNIESRKWAAGTHGQFMKTEDSRQANTRTEGVARNADGAGLGVETGVTTRLRTKAELEQESGLMEAVCERGNLMLAYQRGARTKRRSRSRWHRRSRVQSSPQATLADDQDQATGG